MKQLKKQLVSVNIIRNIYILKKWLIKEKTQEKMNIIYPKKANNSNMILGAYPPIVMNIYDTNYSVVRQVAQEMMKWKLIYEPESLDWDVYWTDSGVSPETLSRMKCIQIEKYELEYQKINHFPGMYILARKNNLGKQLTKMKRRFTKEYHFFPQTWMLPSDINEFKEYCKTSKGKHFIVKPEAACQGRGIFLTRNSDFANSMDRYVVQKYISKPFLIDGLKFDFRIYVLLAGCDPLRIFIYTEGLARFSTEVYEEPNQNNYQNLCMHLTNYAINKNNENFIFNEDVQQMDVGHKRSMSSVFEKLREMGHDIDVLWMEVKDVVIKTLCSAQPFLKHQYTTSQPNNLMNNMCFELLGFDIILDEQFRPYILEVNHSPSFTTDSPLDAYIKSNLIQDSLILMNVTPEEKQRMIQEKNQEMKKRIYTGRNVRMTLDDRKMIVEQNQLIRDAYEDDHLGGFEKIYPCDEDYETEYYQKYINFASDQFEESTGTKKPLFMKRQVIQTTPQKQQTKKDEITQIYSKASTFLQKPFLKSSQGQRQQMKMLREDHQFTAETAYRQSIKMQILSEQKKIQELIKKKKRDESQLSQSYQGQRTSLQLKLNRDLRRK